MCLCLLSNGDVREYYIFYSGDIVKVLIECFRIFFLR